MTAICVEIEGFRTTNNNGLAESLSLKKVLKQLPKRFRLCWKKAEVQDSIQELRDFTADFNELTTRIVGELKEMQIAHTPGQGAEVQSKLNQLSGLQKCHQVRSASYQLYNTFAMR